MAQSLRYEVFKGASGEDTGDDRHQCREFDERGVYDRTDRYHNSLPHGLPSLRILTIARYAEKSDMTEKTVSRNATHPIPGISYCIETGCTT